MTVIIPGSYDPVTVGHLDLIKRASKLFDEVYVVIMINPEKVGKYMFDEQTRLLMLENCLKAFSNVKVDVWHGLMVDYVKQKGIDAVVKGIRNEQDYKYELELAKANAKLLPGLQTLFLASSDEYENVSSGYVRGEIKKGNITLPVPDEAYEIIKKINS